MATPSSGRLVVLGGALCLALGVGGLPPLASQAPGQSATSKVVSVEQLTKRQFRALPDDTLIDVRGPVRTKADILAEAQRAGDEEAGRAWASAPPGTDLAAIEAEVRRREGDEIAAENARVQALMANRKQAGGAAETSRREAIRREALELLRRAATASPAERVGIEKRAEELLREVQGQ